MFKLNTKIQYKSFQNPSSTYHRLSTHVSVMVTHTEIRHTLNLKINLRSDTVTERLIQQQSIELLVYICRWSLYIPKCSILRFYYASQVKKINKTQPSDYIVQIYVMVIYTEIQYTMSSIYNTGLRQLKTLPSAYIKFKARKYRWWLYIPKSSILWFQYTTLVWDN